MLLSCLSIDNLRPALESLFLLSQERKQQETHIPGTSCASQFLFPFYFPSRNASTFPCVNLSLALPSFQLVRQQLAHQWKQIRRRHPRYPDGRSGGKRDADPLSA